MYKYKLYKCYLFGTADDLVSRNNITAVNLILTNKFRRLLHIVIKQTKNESQLQLVVRL